MLEQSQDEERHLTPAGLRVVGGQANHKQVD